MSDNKLPKYAMTYVVYWPEEQVLKVGRAWKFNRVQMMTRSGGQIIILARNTDATWEREALRILTRWFPKAFSKSEQAEGLLFMGRGFSECFVVDEYHLQFAVDLIIEGFAAGNDQGWNEEDAQTAANDQAGAMDSPGAVESIPGCPTNRDGVVGDSRRRGPVGVASGSDSRVDLPGGSDDHTGADRVASFGAGRGRVSDDLSSVGERVDSVELATVDAAPEAFERPATTDSGTFQNFHGCGGSGSEGACGSASGGGGGGACGGVDGLDERARGQDPACSPDVAGCPADWLPGASAWKIRGLWPLRYSTQTARSLVGARTVHNSAYEVRGGAGRCRVLRPRRTVLTAGWRPMSGFRSSSRSYPLHQRAKRGCGMRDPARPIFRSTEHSSIFNPRTNVVSGCSTLSKGLANHGW